MRNMKLGFMMLLLSAFISARGEIAIEHAGDHVSVQQNGKELFSYQIEPLINPAGGDEFKGSNFIHPLKTPSGFCVTDFQPKDHLHHFGLWWPWKIIKVDGRKIVCWELQKGEGLIQGRKAEVQKNGFIAESDYIDRTAPDGPLVVLKEKTSVLVFDFKEAKAKGYFLDITIGNRCATESAVEVMNYRYSGFSIRGSKEWNNDTSIILTSEGKGRRDANFTRSNWVRIEGKVPAGGRAGILMMGHPMNRAYPEHLRTWDEKQHNGAVFINFNPVKNASWNIEPGKTYTRRYRVYIYDGELNKGQADGLWEVYKDEK